MADEKTLQDVSADLLRKVPPQNLEAEAAVLGGIFLNDNIFSTISEIVSEDDFYSPAHAKIYAAFVELWRASKPIDVYTVPDVLEKSGTLDELGGRAYLAELATSVVSAANTEHHARIVKEKSIARAVIEMSTMLISRTFEQRGEIAELVDEAQQEVFKLSQANTTESYRPSKYIVKNVISILEKIDANRDAITGVNTGYHKFNEYTAGLQKSDLLILAARPAMGKTAFALNLALNAAVQHDEPTVVFSLEMSMEQLMMRLMSIQAQVELTKFRKGGLTDDEWFRIQEAADVLSKAPIFIDDTPSLNIMDMRSRCRRLYMENGIRFVIVDYLQLMRASRRIDSREQEISDISRNLKAIAKELNVPVLALSQLNRKVEERGDKRPMMSDLRESGAIEQDADIILFIYRDEVYNKDTPKKGLAEIIIGKQRSGPTGSFELVFEGKYTAFRNANLNYEQAPSESGFM